jgi:hypothetical protein
MSTTLVGNPASGSFVNVQDQTSAVAGAAGKITLTAQLGSSLGTQWTIGTGSPTSLNQEWSGILSLAGATQTLDLTNLTDAIGTKNFAKVRVVRVQSLAAADSGFGCKIESGATNGWTNGPFAPVAESCG